MTVSRRGVTRTVGLPGTGLFWTSRVGLHSGYHSAASRAPGTSPRQQRDADRHVELMLVLVVLAALVVVWLVL